MMSTIKIVTRNASFHAKLDSSDISNEIWLSLPYKADINMFGGEMYFVCPVSCPLGDRRTTILEKGDIAYWPEAEALCIFFGPTPYSGADGKPVSKFPVIKIGSIIGDCSELENAGDRTRIMLDQDFI